MKTLKQGVTGAIAGILSGLFGAGGGVILILALERVFKLEPHKAHATTVAIVLPMACISAIIYVYNEQSINWLGVLYVSAGGILGGYLGAKYFKKISGKNLHRIFGIFMIIAALNMIFR